MPPPKKPKTGPTTAEQFLTKEELKCFQAESSNIQQKITSGKPETVSSDEPCEPFSADSSSELDHLASRSSKRVCDDGLVQQQLTGSSSDTSEYSSVSNVLAPDIDPCGRNDLTGSNGNNSSNSSSSCSSSAVVPSNSPTNNEHQQVKSEAVLTQQTQSATVTHPEYSIHESSVSNYQILRRLFAHAKSPKSTSEPSAVDHLPPSGSNTTITSYKDEPSEQAATSTTSVDVTEVAVSKGGNSSKTLTSTDSVSTKRDSNISNKNSAGILQATRKSYLSSYINQTPKLSRLTEEPSAGSQTVQRHLAASFLQEQPFDLTLKCKDTQFNGAIVDPLKHFISKSSSRIDSNFEHLSSASENYLRHCEQQQQQQQQSQQATQLQTQPQQQKPPAPPQSLPSPARHLPQQQKKVKLEREAYVISTNSGESGGSRTDMSEMLVKREESRQEEDGSHHVISILTGNTTVPSTEPLMLFNVIKPKTTG
ncbi:serine/threonine-protein kinase phg2-like [Octopus sinensis]|uniref:Serine/threonine-protein kinase phg2-like n=1 Tax=Octopus sinensis TaxID=2607531 RepID=A0A6P7T530_9MOLL|nr:serine/threonine-protein kinase phg2-like [Octopus sinensis]